MAITIAKRQLGGSTDGLPISVSASTVSATLVHTAASASSVIDEIWIYAVNSATTTVSLFMEWGISTATTTISSSHLMRFEVNPQDGPQLLIPGFLLRGRTTNETIRVGASTTGVLAIHGWVNRITET